VLGAALITALVGVPALEITAGNYRLAYDGQTSRCLEGWLFAIALGDVEVARGGLLSFAPPEAVGSYHDLVAREALDTLQEGDRLAVVAADRLGWGERQKAAACDLDVAERNGKEPALKAARGLAIIGEAIVPGRDLERRHPDECRDQSGTKDPPASTRTDTPPYRSGWGCLDRGIRAKGATVRSLDDRGPLDRPVNHCPAPTII
ncbi:MAG: hypothetical protein AAFR52_02980, partial [Pseudomonadota bacterium]